MTRKRFSCKFQLWFHTSVSLTGCSATRIAATASMADDEKEGELVFFGKGDEGYNLGDLLGFEAELLGKGSLCSSYKVFLDSGVIVAVKRFFGDYGFGIERQNVQALGELVHENLVPLQAYSFSKHEKLLICDYMSKGSLFVLLHGSRGRARTLLSWENRTKIAYGVACGINYLHSQGLNICHGNIRSSNVFLTDTNDALLSEFGLAQLVSSKSKAILAAGYRAPEVTYTYQVSQHADVYSFGVLLLELLTGEAPTDSFLDKKGVNLPGWVRLMFQEKPILDVFDNELNKHQKNGQQMVLLLQLAICCTFQYPNKRPLMSVVTNQIKKICGL